MLKKKKKRKEITAYFQRSTGYLFWRLWWGGTLGTSGWGRAPGPLQPVPYTRANSAKFCYPILE